MSDAKTKLENPATPPPAATPIHSTQDPLTAAIHHKTRIGTTNDDDTLINVHIGNPLRRITELLEEIKKQKAFSFTLKGSLGLMGVVLGLSFIGLFGTTHALCDKGVQTHIGRVKVLQVTEAEPDSIIGRAQRAIDSISTLFAPPKETSPRYRYILETPEHLTVHLRRGRDVTLSTFKNQAVFATGVYDSCSRQITIETPDGIETYR